MKSHFHSFSAVKGTEQIKKKNITMSVGVKLCYTGFSSRNSVIQCGCGHDASCHSPSEDAENDFTVKHRSHSNGLLHANLIDNRKKMKYAK